MKQLGRILSLLILVSASVHFTACDGGGDDEKSEKEQQIDKLVGTWTAQAVTLDGQAQAQFLTSPFKITITKASAEAMTFTTSGRPSLSPWDSQGTFTFGTPVASQLARNDNQTVGYTVSGNNLQLTIQDYTGTGYNGRTGSVQGDWSFSLTK